MVTFGGLGFSTPKGWRWA